MRIALCDDDHNELQKVKKVVSEFILTKQHDCQISLHTFSNGDDLLRCIDKDGEYDLLILDIIMPGMNGIELATEIRRKNTQCKIIFLTSSQEYAVRSYQVGAFYYLLKPFSENELKTLLCKMIDTVEKEKSVSIVIKEAGKLTRIQIHTILYIESVKHTIYFHLLSGEVPSCYATIREFSDMLLSDTRFIKSHKSFVVNMNHVISISSKDFVMSDKTQIPISRQAYQDIKNIYIDYFFKRENSQI